VKDQINWHRLEFFRIHTIFNNKEVIIGKDRGSMDLHTFYYLEIGGKVVQHGFGTQKEAKKFFIKKYLNKES
jgi:hypothetical protein